MRSGAAASSASDAPSRAARASPAPSTAGDTGVLRVSRRASLKSGYLFKQSSGKWKRRRWNQRWFVLDCEAGVLKHFRHASPLEAVPFRPDAHGAMALRQAGASLVIQGDLPRGAPSPFCFTVHAGGGRELRICANSNAEFRDWTSAISAVLGPSRLSISRHSGEALASPLPSPSPASSPPAVVESASPRSAFGEESEADSIISERDTARHALGNRSARRQDTSAVQVVGRVRDMVGDGTTVLIALNPLIVFVRFGADSTFYLCICLLNAFCVWMLWIHAPSQLEHQSRSSLIGGGGVIDAQNSKAVKATSRVTASARAREDSHATSEDESGPKLASTNLSTHDIPTTISGTVNGVRAIAGSSVRLCDPEPADIVPGCWTQLSATRFNVRQGPNYRKAKLKSSSAPALLNLLTIDVYQSQAKIDNIASIVDLSSLKSANGEALDLFIVNCQVPSYAPSNPLWGEKQGDGPGFNFVTYFAIPPRVREMMRVDDPPLPAVKLLRDFMQTSSNMSERFKAIGIVVNPKEQQLGRTERHLLETYNGQPILTRPQHRFYRGDGYFEVDVDAHEFNYVARKGLSGVSTHFPNMVVDFGFVLEGQEDHELPEQVLGGVRLCKIDVLRAPMMV